MVRCEMGNWLRTDMRASHKGLGSFHFTTKLHDTVWAKAPKGVKRRPHVPVKQLPSVRRASNRATATF